LDAEKAEMENVLLELYDLTGEKESSVREREGDGRENIESEKEEKRSLPWKERNADVKSDSGSHDGMRHRLGMHVPIRNEVLHSSARTLLISPSH
jgi:hypothetical protein